MSEVGCGLLIAAAAALAMGGIIYSAQKETLREETHTMQFKRVESKFKTSSDSTESREYFYARLRSDDHKSVIKVDITECDDLKVVADQKFIVKVDVVQPNIGKAFYDYNHNRLRSIICK